MVTPYFCADNKLINEKIPNQDIDIGAWGSLYQSRLLVVGHCINISHFNHHHYSLKPITAVSPWSLQKLVPAQTALMTTMISTTTKCGHNHTVVVLVGNHIVALAVVQSVVSLLAFMSRVMQRVEDEMILDLAESKVPAIGTLLPRIRMYRQERKTI